MDRKVLKGPAAELPLVVVPVGKPRPRLIPAVQYASEWALATAAAVAFSFALYLGGAPVPAALRPLTSWLVAGSEITDAQAAQVGALASGILWCTAPQAAAVLALLLAPHRRRARRALAYAALAAAAVDHWMFAAFVGVLVAAEPMGYPGWFFFMIFGYAGVLALAVGDLAAMSALLLEGDE